ILLLFIIGTKNHHFSRISVFLGNLTYSFYLIHYYCIIILSKFVNWNRINGRSILAAVIVILATTFAAFITYHIVELKAGNFLKNILSGFSAADAAQTAIRNPGKK
ncbi:MAG: hypothetical protein NC245_17070, partial [Muribaculum sp.]|nr:hypothetical protein [Muribaculum sp.]